MIKYSSEKWAKRLPVLAKRNLDEILNIAFNLGYDLVKVDENTGMLRFNKEDVYINVYSTVFTVTTEIHHPKKGKTQLHRKLKNDPKRIEILEKIFKNPRVHTGKGYYNK